MSEFNCFQIAAKMLDIRVDELPYEVTHKLSSMEELIHKIKPGGSLCSTQVISSIVYDYLKEKNDLK